MCNYWDKFPELQWLCQFEDAPGNQDGAYFKPHTQTPCFVRAPTIFQPRNPQYDHCILHVNRALSLSLPIPLYRSRLPCLDAIHRHLFCDGCADAAMPNNQSLPILLATSLDLCDLWISMGFWNMLTSNHLKYHHFHGKHVSSSQHPHLLAGHIHLSWQGCSPQNHQACHWTTKPSESPSPRYRRSITLWLCQNSYWKSPFLMGKSTINSHFQ